MRVSRAKIDRNAVGCRSPPRFREIILGQVERADGSPATRHHDRRHPMAAAVVEGALPGQGTELRERTPDPGLVVEVIVVGKLQVTGPPAKGLGPATCLAIMEEAFRVDAIRREGHWEADSTTAANGHSCPLSPGFAGEREKSGGARDNLTIPPARDPLFRNSPCLIRRPFATSASS